jgi:hypothetical protein
MTPSPKRAAKGRKHEQEAAAILRSCERPQYYLLRLPDWLKFEVWLARDKTRSEKLRAASKPKRRKR